MFRFSIRDVLWLMVVGLGFVWGVDHRRAIRSENQVEQLTETVRALKAENVVLKRDVVRMDQALTLA